MFSIVTNMVSAEVNGMRAGTVSSWTLAAIGAMNADISGAGAIGYPVKAGPFTADYLTVCTNWSDKLAAPAVVDNTVGNTVTTYCYTDLAGVAPYPHSILRKVTANGVAACPAAVPPACTVGNYGGNSIVATGVYRDAAADTIFIRDANTLNAVRMRFVVGNPAAGVSAGSNGGTNTQVPVSVPFSSEIILED